MEFFEETGLQKIKSASSGKQRGNYTNTMECLTKYLFI